MKNLINKPIKGYVKFITNPNHTDACIAIHAIAAAVVIVVAAKLTILDASDDSTTASN